MDDNGHKNEKRIEDDTLLPVHFMPEGKKCFDWITDDLRETHISDNGCYGGDEQRVLPKTAPSQPIPIGDPRTRQQNVTYCHDSFEPMEVSKTKRTKSINSYTYSTASMNLLSTSASDKEAGLMILKAAEKGDVEQLKVLLCRHPLLVNAVDSDGYTALHRVSYSGHEQALLYLLKCGANVNARTNDGWQPLHCAARWNQVGIASILLEHKADVNGKTNGSQTPLHFAALSEDNKQLLEMLLLHPNIDTGLRNAAGDTAFELASRSGQHVQLFELADPGLKI